MKQAAKKYFVKWLDWVFLNPERKNLEASTTLHPMASYLTWRKSKDMKMHPLRLLSYPFALAAILFIYLLSK